MIEILEIQSTERVDNNPALVRLAVATNMITLEYFGIDQYCWYQNRVQWVPFCWKVTEETGCGWWSQPAPPNFPSRSTNRNANLDKTSLIPNSRVGFHQLSTWDCEILCFIYAGYSNNSTLDANELNTVCWIFIIKLYSDAALNRRFHRQIRKSQFGFRMVNASY